jgi:hypothetical protein
MQTEAVSIVKSSLRGLIPVSLALTQQTAFDLPQPGAIQ